jgi:hypothetical protein
VTAAEGIAEILRTVQRIEAAIAKLGSPATTGATVASDADLDGQWGDPEIRKDPPRWQGTSYAGRRYSQTEPAYLDNLADFYAWKATRDAARARGWAARLRAGPPPAEVADDPFGHKEEGTPDDEIPF